MSEVGEARRRVFESLIVLAAPTADQVRVLVDEAVARQDAEALRREGHDWSGVIGLDLLLLADAVEAEGRANDGTPR
jgi:hypothetical protein